MGPHPLTTAVASEMAYWYADDIIDVIFIILYSIVLVANIFNCFKHGITREGGYVLLVLVSLFKIVGNILTVLSYTGTSSNINVIIWGTILSQLGFYPLVSATLSFLRKWIRIWDGEIPGLRRYLRPIRSVNLIVTAAFILGIVGGVYSNPTSSQIDLGYRLRRASNILFVVAVLIILLFTILISRQANTREQRYDLVILQVYIVVPIMLTRIIYATVQSFLSTPTSPGRNVWVYLGLLLIPDFASITIYTVCGFFIAGTPISPNWSSESPSKESGKGPATGVSMPGDEPIYQEPTYQAQGNQQAPAQPASAAGYGRRYGRGRRRGGPIMMLIQALTDRN